MFTNIYVSKHQFQRFLMIQAGGSTLIRYGLKMDNNDEALLLSQTELHGSHRFYFPYLNNMEDFASRNDILKLIVVRHPFHR